MRIQLVGFDFNLNPIQKVEVFREVVNQSKADFILFPGHTLRDEDDLEYLKSRLTNKDSVVVLELERLRPKPQALRWKRKIFPAWRN